MLHKSPKICLACSAGGHLRELQLAIGAIPEQWDCYWLTLKTTSTKAFMADKEHVFLVNFQPAKKWTLIVNCLQAIFWVLVKRPDVIITTGAGVTVPTVFFAKKLLGTKVIFVNSAADVTHASKTPVWIERYSDLFWSNGKRCGNYFLIQFVVVFYDFASLGTMNIAFNRMAKAVDEWAAITKEEVIVQTGYTDYPYKHAKAFKFCTKEQMKGYISRADILILQGGWGAISEAMELRKRIVVIPRYDKVEHIHDQFQLIRKLDTLGCVLGVFDERELAAKMEQAKTFEFKQIEKGNAQKLIEKKLQEWFPR